MKSLERLPGLTAMPEPRWQRYVVDSILAIMGAMSITIVIFSFQLYPTIPNISLLYLPIVLALAITRGRYAPILASVTAFLSFDFFLTRPFFTFNIHRAEEWLALCIFLITAIITSQLAAGIRQRAAEARRREQETHILYDLVSATNSEADLPHQLSVVAHAMVETFSRWGMQTCSILLPDQRGQLHVEASTQPSNEQEGTTGDERTTLDWVLREGKPIRLQAGSVTKKVREGRVYHILPHGQRGTTVERSINLIPLAVGQRIIGVMRLVMEIDPRADHAGLRLGIDREQPATRFFWTFLEQASTLIERARLRQENVEVELLRRTDALRAALLSSVSHDLRTPLTSIKAAASSLLQEDVEWDNEARRGFAQAIERQADRLNRFVGNLLDMSRIEGGALVAEKEWYPIGDLIHTTLEHLQPILQDRDVITAIPAEMPPVPLDYLQIDQVLSNLIENAARYTPPRSPIEIWVEHKEQEVLVTVADRGPGVAEAQRERIFDKFYRVSETRRSTTGSGLGLAVCRGLIEAHGGHIWEENRAGGGALFRFTLPLTIQEETVHGQERSAYSGS